MPRSMPKTKSRGKMLARASVLKAIHPAHVLSRNNQAGLTSAQQGGKFRRAVRQHQTQVTLLGPSVPARFQQHLGKHAGRSLTRDLSQDLQN